MDQMGKEIICPSPKARALKDLNGKGRVRFYAIELDRSVYVLVYNVHGWTSAARNKTAAERTDDILVAVLEDVKAPAARTNAHRGGHERRHRKLRVPHQRNREPKISRCCWKSGSQVGKCAQRLHTQGTQCSEAIEKGLRFANPEALDLIQNFGVDHNTGLAVHDVLRLGLEGKAHKRASRL